MHCNPLKTCNCAAIYCKALGFISIEKYTNNSLRGKEMWDILSLCFIGLTGDEVPVIWVNKRDYTSAFSQSIQCVRQGSWFLVYYLPPFRYIILYNYNKILRPSLNMVCSYVGILIYLLIIIRYASFNQRPRWELRLWS